jgi:3'(2'), 5'-bisphosphate nucleotidase
MTIATTEYLKSFCIGTSSHAGSSLKFCVIASGEADIYPRLSPTMEWDTAAAHAIVTAAGGRVLDISTGDELAYGKSSLENPFFVVLGRGVNLPAELKTH